MISEGIWDAIEEGQGGREGRGAQRQSYLAAMGQQKVVLSSGAVLQMDWHCGRWDGLWRRRRWCRSRRNEPSGQHGKHGWRHGQPLAEGSLEQLPGTAQGRGAQGRADWRWIGCALLLNCWGRERRGRASVVCVVQLLLMMPLSFRPPGSKSPPADARTACRRPRSSRCKRGKQQLNNVVSRPQSTGTPAVRASP
jgi:hypothetical protein